MAILAVDCHPLEHVISNLVPVFIGPFIMASHVVTLCIWLFEVIVCTINEHSGYYLAGFSLTSRRHDFHHHKFTNCYGLWGFLDYLHGTDKDYRAMRKKEQLQKDRSS